MGIELKELLENLSVEHIMTPYETCPWTAYEEEKEITCSAEVRMDADGQELEAEIDIVREQAEGDEKPFEQLFAIKFKPSLSGKWEPKMLKIKGKDWEDLFYDWDKKACELFSACVQEVKMEKTPDFDALLAKIMKESAKFSGVKGGSGGKAHKVQNKPQAKMNMKSGM